MENIFYSPHHHGSIVVNFRKNPINDLSAFAEGYRNAAMILAKDMAGRGGYPDFDGYPIFFLLRHSLELYMKAIVYRGAAMLYLIDAQDIDTSKLFANHGLARLLPAIKSVFDGVGWKWEAGAGGLENFQEFCEVVGQIDSLDPDSHRFRYPITKKGLESVPHHTVINILEFAERMDEILALMEGAICGLDEMFDAAASEKFEKESILRGLDQ